MKAFFENKKIKIVLLAVILVLGATLRLCELGVTPSSINWDEASLGYNAYSIFETGKDEYGKTLPVVLRSFNDYKPALYAYLITPFYKIFGLNEFAVRLPSAIFGILTLLSVYFLTRKLFKKESIALLTTFLLAISPWHIQFSRIAFEANVGLALNVFAATFFLYGLKKHWMLIFAAIFAGLSVHAYQSDRVFAPLFVLGMIIIYLKPLMIIPKKYLALSISAGIIIVLPLIVFMLTDSNALLRAKGTSIFSDNMALLQDNAQRNKFNIESGNRLGEALDNRRTVYVKTIIDGYLSHYSPNWLLKGDLARHHAPEMGLIYIWEFPFILIGIYILLFSKFNKKTKYFIFFWFLLAPIPASITTGVPHAVRTLNFLPTWQIFTALGLITAYGVVSSIRYSVFSIKLKHLIFIFYILFFIFNFLYYLNQYFVQQNYFHARDWLYGYKQVVSEVVRRENNFSRVIISDKEPMNQSYIFYLFFSQYNPTKYQELSISLKDLNKREFDKYSFRPILWSEDKNLENTLFVGLPSEIPPSDTIFTVYYPDGMPAMVIAER